MQRIITSKVLLDYADQLATEVARERAMSMLKPEHQARIEQAYAAFADEPGFACVATRADIGAQGWSLSIPLYVKRPSAGAATAGEAVPTLPEVWAT